MLPQVFSLTDSFNKRIVLSSRTNNSSVYRTELNLIAEVGISLNNVIN